MLCLFFFSSKPSCFLYHSTCGAPTDDVIRGAWNASPTVRVQLPPPVTHYSSYSLYLVTSKQRNCTLLRIAWFVHCGRNQYILLKATCSPNPNPRASRPGLAGHLVLPHEPIHPLYLLRLIFFYTNIIIFIRDHYEIMRYKQTQRIHTVKKYIRHGITI